VTCDACDIHATLQRAEAIGAGGGAFASADQEADAVSVVAVSVAGGQQVGGLMGSDV